MGRGVLRLRFAGEQVTADAFHCPRGLAGRQRSLDGHARPAALPLRRECSAFAPLQTLAILPHHVARARGEHVDSGARLQFPRFGRTPACAGASPFRASHTVLSMLGRLAIPIARSSLRERCT